MIYYEAVKLVIMINNILRKISRIIFVYYKTKTITMDMWKYNRYFF